MSRWYVDCVNHKSGAFALLGGADKSTLLCAAAADDAWNVPAPDAAVFPAAAAAAAGGGGGGGDADSKAAKKAAKAAEAAAKKAKLEAKKAKMAELEAAKKAKEASGEGGKKDDKKKKKAAGDDDEDKAALQAALDVPKGEWKDPSKVPMAKAYNPKGVESAWYEWWEKEGFFKPTMGSKKPKFVIVIPPPNVTAGEGFSCPLAPTFTPSFSP